MIPLPQKLTPFTAALVLLWALVGSAPAQAAVAPPLGQLSTFAVHAGTSVVNIGPTALSGNLGVSPGAVVTGFPPGTVTGGSIHAADATSQQAAMDATAAYNAMVVQPCDADLSGQDLGGMTLPAGVYCFASSVIVTGTLTLDALGDPNAVFVFKIGSTLGSAVGASVQVINGGSDCNVFWQVGSSSTIGTNASFVGNIVALVSITLNSGSSVSGRVIARNGTVSLDSNPVAICPTCGTIFLSPAGLPDGEVALPYSQLLTASGGTGPYNFAVTGGTLPPGLLLAQSGEVSGTPTMADSFAFTVTATDASGCTGSQSYGLIVLPSGGSSGDPHLRTLDGLGYDFQACGDFVLVTTPGRDLEVQVRQKPWVTNPLTSVNTQIGIQSGQHNVVLAAVGGRCKSTPELPDVCVWADGQVVSFGCEGVSPAPGCARFALLADGTRIDEAKAGVYLDTCGKLRPDAACVVKYLVKLPTGEAVTACLQNGYLNVRVAVNTALHPVSGLLGNADGNPSNDLALRAGGHIALVPNPNHADFYHLFGESWRVPASESLLGPDPEPAVLCGTKSFTAADLSDQSRNHAAQSCLSAGIAPESMQDCILDVAVMGESAVLAFVGLAAPREVLTLRMEPTDDSVEPPVTGCGDDCGISGSEAGPSGCSQSHRPAGAAAWATMALLLAAWLLIRVRPTAN